MNEIIMLGIETSCDETAAAVVVNGRKVLSNVIASQVDIHREHGGVVPEIAARKHMESISYVVKDSLVRANLSLSDIHGIAVSNGPGLVGALLVGLSFAKSLAFARRIPLLGVHHIYSHICANYLDVEVSIDLQPSGCKQTCEPLMRAGDSEAGKTLEPPFICLVVSGGHTHLVEVEDYNNCRVLGRTRDDAVGEAFDKVGRALGMPYPGGPEVDRLAKEGNPEAIHFPRTNFEGSLDFSFSGLKSAVLRYMQKSSNENIADVAASFQQAAIDVLVSHTMKACKQKDLTKVALAGGVAANSALRNAMVAACRKYGLALKMPSAIYCTDNAAMVAGGGYYRYMAGIVSGYDLNAHPNMDIEQ